MAERGQSKSRCFPVSSPSLHVFPSRLTCCWPCVRSNYDVPSTMPPDDPVRRADTIPLEELAAHADEQGLVKVRTQLHSASHWYSASTRQTS